MAGSSTPRAGRLPRALVLLVVVTGCSGVALYSAEKLLLKRTGHSWLIAGWSGLGPTIYDPLLGWTSAPSSHWPDLYGPGNDCSYNARGFRSTREHRDAPPPGISRMLILGDSFAEGLGVGDEETFLAVLEDRNPGIQVVNMAKISYGIDQAILRYERDAAEMTADLVVLSAIDDDLNRSRWDRFNGYWPKPRFEVDSEGVLELTGVPVPDFSEATVSPLSLLRRSALYLIPRRYFVESRYQQDDRALARGLFDRLLRIAGERNQRVALLYLPTLEEVSSDKVAPLAGFMEDYADEHEVLFVQGMNAFAGLPRGEAESCFLESNGHYSERGHRRMAAVLADRLL